MLVLYLYQSLENANCSPPAALGITLLALYSGPHYFFIRKFQIFLCSFLTCNSLCSVAFPKDEKEPAIESKLIFINWAPSACTYSNNVEEPTNYEKATNMIIHR